MTWDCNNCKESNDDELDLCWQCGSGRDGSPAPKGWRSELAGAPASAERRLVCLRCAAPMAHVGRKKFHEGSYAADIFFGDFFVNRESFDIYTCPACGKMEFYATGPAA